MERPDEGGRASLEDDCLGISVPALVEVELHIVGLFGILPERVILNHNRPGIHDVNFQVSHLLQDTG